MYPYITKGQDDLGSGISISIDDGQDQEKMINKPMNNK